MSYPYSFGSHPDFDALKALWDKNEKTYNDTKKVLEESGKSVAKDVENKIKELKNDLVWSFSIENHADGWKTLVKTCLLPSEIQIQLGDFCKQRVSRRFKIIENKYLIVGQSLGNSCSGTKALEDSKNGMILEDYIVRQIMEENTVPTSTDWRFTY